MAKAVDQLRSTKMEKAIFMGTLLRDRLASPERLEASISLVVSQCDLSYLLNKHVEKGRWIEELQHCFSMSNVDDLTDFNYSNCFSYAFNDGDACLRIGTPAFLDYLRVHGELNRVHILISALGPYLTVRLLRYLHTGGTPSLMSVHEPVVELHKRSMDAAALLCERNGLYCVEDEDLKRRVRGVSTQLAGDQASIFNVLFEDGRSPLPY